MQLTHHSTKFEKTIYPITLVCDNVTNAPNIGSLFRVADAFGLEKLILCGDHIHLGRKMTKTSRSTEKYVLFEIVDSTYDMVNLLKKKGYQVIALELTALSHSLYNYKFETESRMALVVGDENFGISEDVLKLSDAVIHIDMFGNNSSMNVVQATSIALFEIIKQMRSPN